MYLKETRREAFTGVKNTMLIIIIFFI